MDNLAIVFVNMCVSCIQKLVFLIIHSYITFFCLMFRSEYDI